MLDLDAKREGAPPRDAATLVLVRDTPEGVAVFCVERHPKSGFMGGAIVFPGGKLDAADADPAWNGAATAARPGSESLRALAIAACRESLEEAAILPVTGGPIEHAAVLDLRSRAKSEALHALLAARGLRLDLDQLRVFARWITPIAEARRFDARFFLCVAPEGQPGAHDDRETTTSFWARPADVLARYQRGDVQVMPPTHRTLEWLAAARTTAEALKLAESACLDPICPKLVRQGDTLALTLPGDPEHDVRDARVAGKSRFVLRGERWLPEDPPNR
jgi:8-oxo-dGTP pyrophosphatase MutT (NUDIX family)